MTSDDPKSRRSKAAPPADPTSGRVSFDERGNAVWEWSVATGRFTTAVSTARLKKLEHPGLSLVDEDAPPAPVAAARPKPAAPRPAWAAPPAAAPAARRAGAGYSPYDSGIPAPKPAGKSAQAPVPKKTDLRRLGEFFALRKQAERNKNGKD